MSEFGFYSFSESFKPGIDFNTPDESIGIASNLTIQTNLAVNALIERLVSSSITVESNSTVTALRIVHAQSSIVVDGATLTLGTRVKLASIAITINSNATVDSEKIAFASTAITVGSNLSASAQEILNASAVIQSNSSVSAVITKTAKASISITPTSNVSTVATKIMKIASSISSNVNLTIVGKIVLATIRINIFNNSSITAKTIKFSNSATTDMSIIRSLLMLDGVPLTNQNRKLAVDATPIYIENLNWQGDASRYYKNSAANSAAKRVFNLQWSFIPNYENKTVDLRASRNYLNKKSQDGDVHTLTIIKQDDSGTSPYTEENVDVLITNYSENLIRRDLVDNVYYFDCTMSLQEV